MAGFESNVPATQLPLERAVKEKLIWPQRCHQERGEVCVLREEKLCLPMEWYWSPDEGQVWTLSLVDVCPGEVCGMHWCGEISPRYNWGPSNVPLLHTTAITSVPAYHSCLVNTVVRREEQLYLVWNSGCPLIRISGSPAAGNRPTGYVNATNGSEYKDTVRATLP
jgi:hypothetical protein